MGMLQPRWGWKALARWTQGSLADSATLGLRLESRWDSQKGGTALVALPLLGSEGRCSFQSASSRRRLPTGSQNGAGERGIALVITLILLAIITTLAIAFLALTRGETKSVDAMNRTTDAEMAADSALERARAEILGPFITRNSTNFGATNGSERLGPDFMVSVAWDNNRTNSYGAFRNPSPPVFVDTNRPTVPPIPQGPFEDRFFLDLNRNRYFEETGYVTNTTDVLISPGRFQYEIPVGGPVVNWRVGDPQWIGVLQDPRRGHDANNSYIARYAFMVQPIGRSLDANWIHNDSKTKGDPGAGQSGFSRNQGVGSYEINFAGFLSDLNTNVWRGYDYQTGPAFQSTGVAFSDAWQLLNARYNSTKIGIDNLTNHFPLPDIQALVEVQGVDIFGNRNFNFNTIQDWPWPGSASRQNIFSVHDYFNPRVIPRVLPVNQPGIVERLGGIGTNGNSYDRYTYYRMLAQMGTDSAEEEDGKININYVNVRSWVPGSSFRYRSSDLVAWTNATPQFITDMGRSGPELFFLTVVTNLLAREPDLAFMVTNNPPGVPLMIPVMTNGLTYAINGAFPGPLYGGRVHHILQLAANILDATSGSKHGEPFPYHPSIFRPRYKNDSGNVYISNYSLMDKPADAFLAGPFPWKDLESGEIINDPDDLVYGIPLIIGARKGFPSFSEVGVATVAEAWRKLTLNRDELGKAIVSTNQEFSLKAWNVIQVEARNPYTNAIPRPMEIVLDVRNSIVASNSFVTFPLTGLSTNFYRKIYQTNAWPAEPIDIEKSTSPNYVVTPAFQHTILDYRTNTPLEVGGAPNQWFVSLTNRMLFYIVDRDFNRIVDVVTLKPPSNHMNVASLLHTNLQSGKSTQLREIWNPGRVSASEPISLGIKNQLAVSSDAALTDLVDWTDYADSSSKRSAALAFLEFLKISGPTGAVQAPFTPLRRMAQVDYYQVNDPLVHYTFEDLENYIEPGDDKPFIGTVKALDTNLTHLASKNLGKLNKKSMAWNKGVLGEDRGAALRDTTLRDPGLIHSDAWNFPTHALPNVGWLGRVHRGTPWQTIYLKSREATNDLDGDGIVDWDSYAGPSRGIARSAIMRPHRDRDLFDIFTTAPHPNATRGRLSINQTNLAAWSAVLSGTVADFAALDLDPSNPGLVVATNVLVLPASMDSFVQIQKVAQAINTNRWRFNANGLNPAGQYHSLGQVLSTPELSEKSPLLNTDITVFDGDGPLGNARIYDEDYERIPQQILSLLKVGEPRFVVYAWGQSLKPAKRDPDDAGPSILTANDPKFGPKGLISNYQITGEMATRAVIRVEFDRFPVGHINYGQLNYARPHAVVESFNVLPVE